MHHIYTGQVICYLWYGPHKTISADNRKETTHFQKYMQKLFRRLHKAQFKQR